MQEKSSVVFSITKENEFIAGCTVSRSVHDTKDFGINYFSIAPLTDISPEIYNHHKIILVNSGEFVIFHGESEKVLHDGEIFRLAELVPYQSGRIVNMDLVNDAGLKFVVMSFDEGTGLSEHAAPGEALIFALEGHGGHKL